jgi:SAM-dependent methyltransferase
MSEVIITGIPHTGLTFPYGAYEENTRILEVGCGAERLYSISVTLDKNTVHHPDIVHDLEETPYPFPDESFHFIVCRHVLEHVRHFVPAVTELHRILKPGGVIYVEAPYFSSVHAYTDPTHVRFFTSRSFDYFLEGSPQTAFGYSPARFHRIEFEIVVPGKSLFSRMTRCLIHHNVKRYEERWAYLFPRHTIRYHLFKER